MGLFTAIKNAKREHEAQKQRQDNPGFRLTLNDQTPISLTTSEIKRLTDDEIDNNYEVVGRGRDGMLIMRRK